MASDEAMGPFVYSEDDGFIHGPFGSNVRDLTGYEADWIVTRLNAAFAAGRASMEADNERLRRALRHRHYRNHEAANGCDGCRDVAALLGEGGKG